MSGASIRNRGDLCLRDEASRSSATDLRHHRSVREEHGRGTLESVGSAKRRAPSFRGPRGPKVVFTSWPALHAAAIDAARAELRARYGGVEVLSDRWFELWEKDYGPAAVPEAPALAHARSIHAALEGALAYRKGLRRTWDALEGSDRALHEILEEIGAFGLTARQFGRGGLRLREDGSRWLLVQHVLRTFDEFSYRDLSCLSLVAGFAPQPGADWRDKYKSPGDVIEAEREAVRLVAKRMAEESPLERSWLERKLLPGTRRKKP